MAYAYSQTDKTNLDWFDKDTSKGTLIRCELQEGNLRGLEDLKLHFRYPITAISGKNGTGKSTILACVACAYHNTPLGFKTLSRKIPYYTFSDFFIQSAEEIPPAGIHIRYQISPRQVAESAKHPNWYWLSLAITVEVFVWPME